MKSKFITRCEIYEDGSIKEIKVPREESEKLIDELLEEDKELLEILEKCINSQIELNKG